MPDKIEAIQGAGNPVSRKCDECPAIYTPSRAGMRFCGEPCRKAANNRNNSRGGAVVPLLQAWAMTRHAKPGTREAAINTYARREMTAIAAIYRDEDAAANRASVLDHVERMMAEQVKFVDRRRARSRSR